MTEFCCPFCNTWNKIEFWKQHIESHISVNSDGIIVGMGRVIQSPKTYEEMKNRFSQIGLFEEKETNAKSN